jgi:hypothetical protein
MNLNNFKKSVCTQWEQALPELGSFAYNKFYKIQGPTVLGLELIKLPRIEEYRPHFVIYPLWYNRNVDTLAKCLSTPIVLFEFYNKKGNQYSIPYNLPYLELSTIIKNIKNQIPISLGNEISQKQYFSIFDKYSKTAPLNASPSSYLQAKLMRSKLELALSLNNKKIVQKTLKELMKRKWDNSHFLSWGIDYSDWVKSIEEDIIDIKSFISSAEMNKINTKLNKLPTSKLV